MGVSARMVSRMITFTPRRSLSHKVHTQGCLLNIRRNVTTTSGPVIRNNNGDTIIKSPYQDVDIPDVTFTEYVFTKLHQHRDLTCMVDFLTDREYTGGDIKEWSIKVASGLSKLGYKKGDVIMIYANNCPEYAMLFLACGALGISVTTANPVYTAGELARQLEHSETSCIVTMPTMLHTVQQAVKSSQHIYNMIKEIIVIGEVDGYRPFSALREDDGTAFPENVDLDPGNDVISLPYSSGTTGLPKGVMLTHTNLVANLEQMTKGQMQFEPGRDNLMGLLPFYHIYGMVVVQFAAITQGTKLVVLPKFEPDTFLKAIQKHKISIMHLVPPTVLFMAKSDLVDQYDMSSLRTIYCGAAPLGEGLTNDVCNRLGIDIRQVYGLSETSPLTNCDSANPKQGTIGSLVPNTVAKVICPETGICMAQGEEGELVVQGPQVMKGYLKNIEATQSTIKDGWLYTGDICTVDADGYVTISDRLKELIKYKGFQVAPAELEALLITHTAVEDVAVIGVQAGEDIGEVPKAFIVTKPGISITQQELHNFVNENVAPYKKLRGGIQFVDDIPKTASGKILRRLLRGK